jgi:amidase
MTLFNQAPTIGEIRAALAAGDATPAQYVSDA